MAGKRAIIVGGGSIDADWASGFLSDADASEERFSGGGGCVIAADRGLVFLDRIGRVPDLIVGDFDSASDRFLSGYLERHPEVPVRRFRPEKDYTDTEIAAAAAAELGCKDIDLIGATGTRLDHVLGAVQVLALLQVRGCTARMLDAHNRITLHAHPFSLRREDQWGDYVSFFPWAGEVRGLTLTGFFYPLRNHTLLPSGTLSVSNRIVEATAHIDFRSGVLLMIESKD